MAVQILKSPNLATPESVITRGYGIMTPPTKLRMSEWADKKIILSPKVSAEPGPFQTSRIPYAKEPMDEISNPRCREVTGMWAAQCAKTTVFVDIATGYFMEQDPSRIAVILENGDKRDAWSLQRFTPMVDESPDLSRLLSHRGGPDSQNTIDFKDFPGGYLAILNAGSEGDLTSRAARVAIKDEIDKWLMLNGGDPDTLADKRVQNSYNKKIVNVSTPRDHSPEDGMISRISVKYESSDKRKYYVACPFCHHLQILLETHLRPFWSDTAKTEVEDVKYECEKCNMLISHMHKRRMLTPEAGAKWIAQKPFRGHAGFWLNALYSPWISWLEYFEAFRKMKRQSDMYKTFVNEWRCEPWNPQMGAEKDTSPYLQRREKYDLVPLGAAYLTAAVDVQGDRLECDVKAWGPDRESWGIEHRIFLGEPLKLTSGTRNLPAVWQKLDAYLQQTWEHESGAMLPLSIILVDSGDGNATTVVYRFCRSRRNRNVFPCKGVGGAHEIINRGKIVGKEKVRLFSVGVNECKNIIFDNLAAETPIEQGQPYPAGFMHFNESYDAEYFKQLLTSERKVYKTVNKTRMQVWEKITPSARNEALDLNVYALAGFERLQVAKSSGPSRPSPIETRVAELRKLWEKKKQEEGEPKKDEVRATQEPEKAPPAEPAAKKSLFKNLGRVRV